MNGMSFLKNYSKLRDKIGGAIMSNVNISIREGNREVWNCNDGTWKNKLFKDFRVVQEFDVETFLNELLPMIEKVYRTFGK